MGRLLRFLKLSMLLSGILISGSFYASFNGAPEAGKIKGLADAAFQSGDDFPVTKGKVLSRSQTQALHDKVKGDSIRDEAANAKRENSFITYFQGRKWVFIQGKYYLYNSKNVYLVNGVRTLYEPPLAKKQSAVHLADAKKGDTSWAVQSRLDSKLDSEVGSKVDRELGRDLDNPLQAYTPDAMSQLKDNLKKIEVNIKNRDQALRQLQKE